MGIDSCKKQPVRIFHDDRGHPRTYKMIAVMRQVVRWKKMERDVMSKRVKNTRYANLKMKFMRDHFIL